MGQKKSRVQEFCFFKWNRNSLPLLNKAKKKKEHTIFFFLSTKNKSLFNCVYALLCLSRPLSSNVCFATIICSSGVMSFVLCVCVFCFILLLSRPLSLLIPFCNRYGIFEWSLIIIIIIIIKTCPGASNLNTSWSVFMFHTRKVPSELLS